MNAKAAVVAKAIATANASASRNARALKTSSVRIQFEADSADIDDEAPDAGGIEVAAQVADLDIDDIGLRHEFEIPHILEQHRPSHDLTGAAHEILEEFEFPRQQIHRLAVAAHGPFDEIHFQPANLKSRQPRVAAAAQERFDPRSQFADFEWFDQIVVAAGLQSVDSLVNRRQRADHQGRRGVAFAAQRLDDRKPVLAMQHSVDDQNGGARTRRPQPIVDRLRQLHRMAARLQFEANLLGKVAL